MTSIEAAYFSSKKRLGGANRSQGVVEFALALPILLMLLFAIIDFSLLFSAWLVIQNMSRQAVRYAVTGEYNTDYCSSGCVESSDQDTARLLSIRDQARNYIPGLLVDNTATAQSQPGYLQVAICSGRDNNADGISDFQTILGVMGSTTQYSECLPVEDPGGPNDTVIVMVDFNHPYITPFLNQVWPMIHLASAQRGVVEQFRISRALSLPPAIFMGSPTPSNTFVPTNTPTSTQTFTRTSTASPTSTATATRTYTMTPTPDCSSSHYDFSTNVFSHTTDGSNRPRAYITIRNNSGQDTYLDSVTFYWETYKNAVPSQTLRSFRYPGTNQTSDLIGAILNPPFISSGSSWVWDGTSAQESLNSGAAGRTFYLTFNQVDSQFQTYSDSFRIVVNLGNGCNVENNPGTVPTPTNTSTPTGTRTPTSTGTITPTPTITNTRTATGTSTNTATFTNTHTPSNTPTKTNTPTITNTSTNTPTSTITPTPTNTPTRTNTPTITNTRTSTSTSTPSSTMTISSTPTMTPTRTNTFTPTSTSTITNTRTSTSTSTPSSTPTASKTPTNTFTPSNTPTKTSTPTITNTATATSTRTITRTPTATNTQVTPTSTPTNTPSPTNTLCPGGCYGLVEPPVITSISLAGTRLMDPQTYDSSIFILRYAGHTHNLHSN
jgi:hypothetical protein